ncbi:VanZ family protein [Microvirga sp. CF3062]|uniref:VanZ family protein n=1 Tax=Microvirga sp. CF3062 TaxID=3110182 RepID=UPI002E779597|nr:VanZ family protein [Microvirga sp. CF3062]MEE1658382.1 VanZ family protein [Microvirga sp. CF3062]
MRLFALSHQSNHRIARVVSWSCAILLAFLSLLPNELEIRTGAPDELEHFFAYFFAAVLFSISYPQKRFFVAGTLVAIAGLLEALQVFSPGRSVRLLDVWFSATGAIFGVVVASLIARCNVRPLRSKQ